MKRTWILLGVAVIAAVVSCSLLVLQRDRSAASCQAAAVALNPSLEEAASLGDISVPEVWALLGETERPNSDGCLLVQRQALLLEALQRSDLYAAERLVQEASNESHTSSDRRTLEWQWLVAELHRKANRPEQALGVVEGILASHPEHPRARLLRADLALDRGEGQVAVRDLELVLAVHPGSAALHNRMAVAAELQGDGQKEVFHLRRALKLDPALAEAWINQGRWMQRQGHAADARRAFERALELDPASSDAHLGRALVCRQLFGNGCPESVKSDLERALELDPSHVSAWLALGDLHASWGDRGLAAYCYREALEVDGQSALAWLRLGNTLVLEGEHGAATEAFERALSVAGDRRAVEQAAAYNGLGTVLLAQGRKRDARVAFQQAVDLNPEDPSPKRNLASL